jgi:hypothetical protein
MNITKCLIWVRPVNWFTGTAQVLRQCGRTSVDVHADWMENIMSKTNDTEEKARELNDAQLAAVTGGLLNAAMAGATAGAAKGAGPTGGAGPVTFRDLANLLGELEHQF